VRVVTASRPERDFVVLTFASTHDAMTAEQAVARAGIAGRSIPRPASMGAGCGIALRLDPDRLEEAVEALARAGISPSARGFIKDR
jgi:hypothetical protein